MKNSIFKLAIGVTLLTGTIFGQGVVTNAAATTNITTTKETTAAPIMRDNLSEYGLKKDLELPVTVTAGGLSYTLEKIMIYETKSATAQSLIKKYGYTGTEYAKYFIWTKITVENKSGNTVQQNYKNLSDKWRLNFGGDYTANAIMPEASYSKPNSVEALWDWSLAPGKKLSTYQAYTYNEKFEEFYVSVNNKGNQNFIEIVKAAGK